MTNKLSDWCWIVDFSNAIVQKGKKIAPIPCESRSEARRIAKGSFPKGSVKKCKITILKEK